MLATETKIIEAATKTKERKKEENSVSSRRRELTDKNIREKKKFGAVHGQPLFAYSITILEG